MGDGDMENMENIRRVVAVEVEDPPPELYAVEEPHRRIVEEVAAYVAERGRLEKEKYNEIYRKFRKLYPLPSQLNHLRQTPLSATRRGIRCRLSNLTIPHLHRNISNT
jgi:hypothetical protein